MILLDKWWPPHCIQSAWQEALTRFYAENDAYHAMTSSGDKSTHPQVRYLLERVCPGLSYAEVGCGGGLVCSLVARKGGRVRGFDISPIAIGNAISQYGSVNLRFDVASADHVPLDDASMDGVWSFEVLEHLWDPVAALREMVRIVKPGGFVFVTCPNHFSLDLHLKKRMVARMADIGCAILRYVQDRWCKRFYINIVPDISRNDVYPDCDMISTLLPCRLPRLVQTMGCRLERLDMFYMCARAGGVQSAVDNRLERYSRWPVVRWFGDHVFLWMVKSEISEE